MRTRRVFAGILAAIALSLGVVVAEAVRPATAHAYTFGGSCGWSTDGQWHWSPTYQRYYRYVGHTVINGLYYRTFLLSAPYPGGISNYVVVYCG